LSLPIHDFGPLIDCDTSHFIIQNYFFFACRFIYPVIAKSVHGRFMSISVSWACVRSTLCILHGEKNHAYIKSSKHKQLAISSLGLCWSLYYSLREKKNYHRGILYYLFCLSFVVNIGLLRQPERNLVISSLD